MTMSALLSIHATDQDAQYAQPVQLEEVVETMCDDAIVWARDKLGWVGRESSLAEVLRRPDFLGYFKHGLAVSVANVLAANDANVQAVYVFDPSLNADSEAGTDLPFDTSVHLLVRAVTPSAALHAFVTALDQALSTNLKNLPAPVFAGRESILDVIVITEEDIRLSVGYAGLLSGVFAPPIRIWQRA
jgi:hypothetical protein